MDYKVLDEEIGIEEDIEEGNIEDDYIALEEKEDSSRTTIDLFASGNHTTSLPSQSIPNQWKGL